jgi:peptide deformylase
MAILKIARMGHPVLATPAGAVSDPTSPEIRRLINDMVETMIDANGAGLAAPQVHVPLRVVVFQAPEGRADPGLSEAERFDHTAPLVERPAHIRYRGLGINGEAIERTARGFHARVVQHECDHLDGRLYTSRMSDLSRLIFESEIRHFQVES